MSIANKDFSRRTLLARGAQGLAGLALGPTLLSLSQPVAAATLAEVGPLQGPDANGIRLPAGFTSRVAAVSGSRLTTGSGTSTAYRWHSAPDGGATFDARDGGWIYVSNSETAGLLGGGAGAVRFASDGSITNAYRILSGTNANCAGGATPWGTWLSCEEIARGKVWECDPFGATAAVRRDALGWFKHEAVAVDTLFGNLYLTEDESDGRLYRFVPASFTNEGYPVLTSGTLQVAVVDATNYVTWANVPNPRPRATQTQTRRQVSASRAFNGGEGIWYSNGAVYFATKGDNRVWRYDTNLSRLSIVYDRATSPTPILGGVDNLTVSAGGDLLVAEDGGDMELVVIDRTGRVAPLLQVTNQGSSEITGPAFSPDGTRLYFSSQRGGRSGSGSGITYEVRGPFRNFLMP